MGLNNPIEDGQLLLQLWRRVDELRGAIFRSAAGVFACMVLAFVNRAIVFDFLIFAPADSDFALYRLMCWAGERLSLSSLCVEPFALKFQNILIAGQFFAHLSVSFWFGVLLAFPWVVYQLWRFAMPMVNRGARVATGRMLVLSSALFFAGAATGYFLAIPLAMKFLGMYQVADPVENIITLTSYADTFVMLALGMGVSFQMPVLILLLSRIGILRRRMLTKYRRHAIVVILLVAAIITPTPDPFTMSVVSLPLVLLYELGVRICKK
ncbi:MAG: twin-arginine translocase subunit TatC [Prevotellaceae bacterium]|jgi:sec-independent protein translocase protein TatC|nr:twin-arginine translocase subunit TatC [Prevotellaceae bacterium]